MGVSVPPPSSSSSFGIRYGHLDANAVALQVVTVELSNDIVDAGGFEGGVQMDEGIVLDDVGFDHGSIGLEKLPDVLGLDPGRQIAHE